MSVMPRSEKTVKRLLSFVLLLGTTVCWSGCQPGEETAPTPTVPAELFVERAGDVGLGFKHFLGATSDFYLPETMGPGVAVFDYDGDGDLDVYFLQGSVLNPAKSLDDSVFPPPKEHFPGNRLFRNEFVPSGTLAFKDVTEIAGVGDDGYG